MFTKTNIPQKIERPELDELIPHRGKMFLLSRVTGFNAEEGFVNTEFDITKDCIFYDKELGGIPSYSSFEIMAQGISVLSSIKKIIRCDTDPASPGVILSVSSFSTKTDVLKCGTTVRMTVKEDYESDGIFKYDCELYAGTNCAEPDVKVSITVMEMKNIKESLKS